LHAEVCVQGSGQLPASSEPVVTSWNADVPLCAYKIEAGYVDDE
jgi:hypothetical protein